MMFSIVMGTSSEPRATRTNSRQRSSVWPVGYVRYRVFRIAQRVDGEKTRIERLLKAEETAQRWIRDVDDAEIPAAQERRDISAEVDCDAVRKSSAAPHGDAQAFAHSAVRAIRRH